MEPRTIRIALTKPKNHTFPIVSWLIRFVEGTEFSHVLPYWHVKSLERDLYYEAVGSGVNFLSWKLVPEKYEMVEIYEFQATDLKKVAQFCHDNAQRKYSKKQIAGLALMRAAKLFGFKIANPFKDGDYSQICVETGAIILESAGAIDVPDDIEDYGLLEFRELLIKHGKRIK